MDRYINHDIEGGNKLFGDFFVDQILEKSVALVHNLLVQFLNKNLVFEIVSLPEDLHQVSKAISDSEKLSDKYVYSLLLLKYQNPVSENFVDMVLERIGI